MAKLSPSEFYKYATTGVYPLADVIPEEFPDFGQIEKKLSDGSFVEPYIVIDDLVQW